jgi:UDP-N-acetylmuramoyl-L-alanyl-D-glutamate--2,6-diaminopimelate ligase
VRLDRALDGLAPVELVGDASVEVDDVVIDHRDVRARTLFVCLRGARTDGHDLAPAAAEAGAVALLCERRVDVPLPQAIVADTRIAMAPVAAAVHGHPSHDLAVVGVTGTNGKTTTTHLLAHVLEACGLPCTAIGTLTGGFSTPTTPEAPALQRMLADARDAGKRAVAVEVSSGGLARHRVDATRFAVAVFTNLSQDHLEEHGTMEAYFEAKASLFTDHEVGAAVICTDDPWGRALTERLARSPFPVRTYSAADVAEDGSFTWGGHVVQLPIAGTHNALNGLAAAHVADLLGLDAAAVAAALSTSPDVRGRFERVEAGQPFSVLVDYSHTPGALAVALEQLNRFDGRLLVAFGCGGERDQSKRAPMGRIAAENADVVVVTTDNPRSEDPDVIIADILAGTEVAARRAADIIVEPDRRAAIARTIGLARPSDVVLIAGKGHETYQEVHGVKHHLDDREEALAALAALGWEAAP